MKHKYISWIFLIITLISAYVISIIDSYNLMFLLLLISNIGFAILYSKSIDKVVLNIGRVLIGILFIYSGIVKGVDPLGTQFKIEDYFFAYGMDWAAPYALLLSVLLNAVEFSMGALLLFRVKIKYISTLSLFMMVMFTITTLYDALYSPVPDCGCFGDALVITNWQTFYKNLVINALVVIVFMRRTDFAKYKSKVLEYYILIGVVMGFTVFEVYNINNLPLIDFRSWKVENRLLPENPQPVKYYLTYENKLTGETKEYLSKELPWQDSIFMADWKWLSSREIDPNISDMNTFPMIDVNGNDQSKEIVSYDGNTYIFIVYKVDKVGEDAAKYIKDFVDIAAKNGLRVVVLNSDLPKDFNEFVEINNIGELKVFNSDDTALKAAIRSNPGLIIVNSGKVVSKYHHNNFPDFDKL
ncbi:MAG: DoxX family protein [Bacteroidales bacterium]|nr:DoxX family protein [Bacteroidales bacterium]